MRHEALHGAQARRKEGPLNVHSASGSHHGRLELVALDPERGLGAAVHGHLHRRRADRLPVEEHLGAVGDEFTTTGWLVPP